MSVVCILLFIKWSQHHFSGLPNTQNMLGYRADVYVHVSAVAPGGQERASNPLQL